MATPLYVVDAFTDRPFTGNPAAVCLLTAPAEEDWMQQVARELNLSETAFVHPTDGGFALRWFTPAAEVVLCGHATLASAFALWHTETLPATAAARFSTKSGWLTCTREGDTIAMDFPAKPVTPCAAPDGLAAALGCVPRVVARNDMDYLVEVESAAVLRALTPDFRALACLPVRGVIVTSPSDRPDCDFLSRFFAPAVGVNEDPVTGSAHCALGPYWGTKRGQTTLRGYQASPRGGWVGMVLQDERVSLRGQAVLMSRVELQGSPSTSSAPQPGSGG